MSIMPFVSNSDTSSTGYKDSKYIVFEKNLMELFETCPVCSRVSDVRTYRRGTFLSGEQKCHHCQFYRQWKSQPVIGASPVGNIQLSAAIYFTGSSYFKVQKVMYTPHFNPNVYYPTRLNSIYLHQLHQRNGPHANWLLTLDVGHLAWHLSPPPRSHFT